MRTYQFRFGDFVFSEEYRRHLEAKLYSTYPELKKVPINFGVDASGCCYTRPDENGFLMAVSPMAYDLDRLFENGEESFSRLFPNFLSFMAFASLHEASHAQHTLFSCNLRTLDATLGARFDELLNVVQEVAIDSLFHKVSNIIEDEAINRVLTERYQGSIRSGFRSYARGSQKSFMDALEKNPEAVPKADIPSFLNGLAALLLMGAEPKKVEGMLGPTLWPPVQKAYQTFLDSGAPTKRLDASKFRLKLALEITLDYLEERLFQNAPSQADPGSGGKFGEGLNTLGFDGESGQDSESFDSDDESCGGKAPFAFTPDIFADFSVEEIIKGSQEIMEESCTAQCSCHTFSVSEDEANARFKKFQDKVIDVGREMKEELEESLSIDMSSFMVEKNDFSGESFERIPSAVREALALAKALERKLLKTRRGQIGYQKSGTLKRDGLIRSRYATDVFHRRVREDRFKDYAITVLLDVSGSMRNEFEELNRAAIMLDVLSRKLNFPIRQIAYQSECWLARDYLSEDSSFEFLNRLNIDGGTNLPGALRYFEHNRKPKELLIILSDSDVDEEDSVALISEMKAVEADFVFLGESLRDFTLASFPRSRQHHVDGKTLGSKFLEIIGRDIFQ